ncbi:hypothetical protein AG1IA_03801 [Rhizoctonia solani AG-1 IA]|uniref:Uncharacterized protein n=1 Tax=Thanatephorus cucumeris (strain AG1-IA) TaxID=983506 RepID=L8X0M3_THACA|nr:hypothetical protein AG1IA_03801 [Rhizoctonia solani AG-1 IA]
MATVLHSWLNEAQESSRYDSVANGLRSTVVVDTPSGMSQTGQNALRFLRSLSEHSPTFFEDQARLLVRPIRSFDPSPHTWSPCLQPYSNHHESAVLCACHARCAHEWSSACTATPPAIGLFSRPFA